MATANGQFGGFAFVHRNRVHLHQLWLVVNGHGAAILTTRH